VCVHVFIVKEIDQSCRYKSCMRGKSVNLEMSVGNNAGIGA